MEIQAPGAGRGELTRPRRHAAGSRHAAARALRVAAFAALLCAALLAAGCGRDSAGERTSDRVSEPEEVVLTPEAAREARKRRGEQPKAPDSKAQVVELLGAGAAQSIEVDPKDDAPSPGAPTDAEVRAELREARASLANFKKHLNTTAFLQTGPRARVARDGTAVAPENAPDVVKRVIMAANEIAKFPYKWGGGHGAWRDNGYDCSGSVSFALAGAGLLGSPLTSGGFLNYGAPGPGRWITIYTNPGHVFMVVGGLRFDTSGQGRAGTRWQEEPRSTGGLVPRHIPGL
jgi:cell wall-associated NlpC family hydrolase